ncbi:hypothetical protein HMPREF2608_10450 [Neisseria sp. HMSC064D07]|nr:hypothetical protein HMPREF2608_10450 [Neisseria sp. HMSC064D07]
MMICLCLSFLNLPIWAAARLETLTKTGGLIPLSGIVFVARAAIENLGCIETNQRKPKETMDTKMPQ